jgi:hypothetical protein
MMLIPKYQAGAQHSLSPLDACGWAMMERFSSTKFHLRVFKIAHLETITTSCLTELGENPSNVTKLNDAAGRLHFFAFSPPHLDFGGRVAPAQFCRTARNAFAAAIQSSWAGIWSCAMIVGLTILAVLTFIANQRSSQDARRW